MSPTLTVSSFLDPYCSRFFVQHHQLEPRSSKTYSKRQNLVQNKNIDVRNLENIELPFWCFSLGFFSALCDFFSNFFAFHQRVSPSFVSIFCHTMDVKKSQRVYIFRHCDTVQKSQFQFFSGNFLKSLKGPPLIFSYFAQLGFHKAQRVPPFTILSLRYRADFSRSRLVCQLFFA